MAKSKKGVSHAGPKKSHGPKKKMFHCWSKTMRLHLSKAGVLDRYNNKDSFILSCQARGLKHGSVEEWDDRFSTFIRLGDKKEQDAWLANCKNYVDPSKERKKKVSSK